MVTINYFVKSTKQLITAISLRSIQNLVFESQYMCKHLLDNNVGQELYFPWSSYININARNNNDL